jgi:hypothetical protein
MISFFNVWRLFRIDMNTQSPSTLNISCDMLDIIMRVTWVDIDYLMNNPDQHIYEPKTFERYLMVSKYEKKILVNCNEVKKRTNRDVYDNRISSYFFWYVFD